MDGEEPQKEHWRHDYAKGVTRKYATSPPDFITGAFVGIGGGVWNAVVNKTAIIWDILIAIGIVIAAMVLSQVIVYLFSWVAAGGYTTRKRITHIELILAEGRVHELPALISAGNVSTSDGMAPVTLMHLSQEIVAVSLHLDNGKLILGRCLDAPGHWGTVSEELQIDVGEWIEEGKPLLDPWPKYKRHFSSTVEVDQFHGHPPVAQLMQGKFLRLNEILELLVRQEGIPHK